MKILLVLICLSLIVGCSTKEERIAYYEAQKAYYENMTSLATISDDTGYTITINRQNIPIFREMTHPLVEGLKTIVNSTSAALFVGGWSIKEFMKYSIGDSYSYSNSSSIDNSAPNDSIQTTLTDNSTKTMTETVSNIDNSNNSVKTEYPDYVTFPFME